MREIRPSGLEGGGAVTPLSLPLSFEIQSFGQHARNEALSHSHTKRPPFRPLIGASLPPQSMNIFGPKVSTTSHCEVDAHPRFEK